MDKLLAGIGLALLLWGGLPFAFYFYLGMGDRSDKAKKFFSVVVIVFGVTSLITAAYCLLFSTDQTEKSFALVYGLAGVLCIVQSNVIFSKIRVNKIECDCKEQLERLAESVDNLVRLQRNVEKQRRKDSYVSEFYRTCLDEKILSMPKNYFKHPSSRIVKITWSWKGFIVSKENRSQFYELIDELFSKLSDGGSERRQEKEKLSKKMLTYFVENIQYDENEESEVSDKYRHHFDLYEQDELVESNPSKEFAFVFTEKYYLRSVKYAGECYCTKSVFNSNFILHHEIYSENTNEVLYDLYGFDYAKKSCKSLYEQYEIKTDSEESVLKELFIIPSSGRDCFYFIRKDVDGGYIFWQIESYSFYHKEIEKISREINDLRHELCPYKFSD